MRIRYVCETASKRYRGFYCVNKLQSRQVNFTGINPTLFSPRIEPLGITFANTSIKL